MRAQLMCISDPSNMYCFPGVGEGMAAISLVKLDKNITVTLDEFLTLQQEQSEYALMQLNCVREKVVELVWESCAVCIASIIIDFTIAKWCQ